MKKSKEFYLEKIKQIAISKGGVCLSTEYVNSKAKLEFQCAKKHLFEANPNNIKTGHWCPECGGTKKKTIDDCHKGAKSRGGKCLSTVYLNNRSDLKWQCKEMHEWQAPYSSIKTLGHWCPECGGTKKKTIDDCHEIAKSRNGKCLSTVYVNCDSKLEWQCHKKHTWIACYDKVKQGRWCPYCAGKHITIEDCHEIANKNNGKCLSTEYVNSSSKLEWQCHKKHEWEAFYSNVKKGHWCPECAGNIKKTIEDCHEIAKSKGGKCLSTQYVNCDSKLKWQCHKKHIWETPYSNIQQGSWCPDCSTSKSEKICRYIFETIFKKPFPVIKPDFLKTKKYKWGLELDGFCENLNLAFEHQGRQHYEFVERFHRTPENFKNQLQRDQDKKDLCKKNNVKLIEIPAIGNIIKTQDVPDFIVNELNELKFKVENPFKDKDILEEYYKSLKLEGRPVLQQEIAFEWN
ncbi:hypothetical protein AB834_00070 [PVC group bacterium (ex Bugula neritina AB1)]|nr:hypothetical protein AB834_00070 [PVC group bacterium (ex Bugula neritina AB1)]